MKITVYKDDSLTDVSRIAEADKLKIPYRVSMFVIQSLDNVNMSNDDDVIRFLARNIDKLDKILKATFELTDDELECLDTAELIETAKEIYKWVVDKVNSLKGGSKNVPMTAVK